MSSEHSIEALNALDDQQLRQLDWKNLSCLNGRLLELHGLGELGNEHFAKLPLKPILCIDQIDLIDEKQIQASFTFPSSADQWPFDERESLEMLFQDQLDQLVGFWGSRKADGIGRALSSGACEQQASLDFVAGKTIRFQLQKRKWIENSNGGGTAVFNGEILDDNGNTLLATRNVIVGILHPDDVNKLRLQHGGTLGVEGAGQASVQPLKIPVYDEPVHVETDGTAVSRISAIQQISPRLWPLRYHFRGDPVVPGNFGTHGMIALLKLCAERHFGLSRPIFKSLSTKKFAGMIFEDPKQIRFELLDLELDGSSAVVAREANLYLENSDGQRMIDTPIYTFKNLTVHAADH